jgi:hypothetical protein
MIVLAKASKNLAETNQTIHFTSIDTTGHHPSIGVLHLYFGGGGENEINSLL